MVLKTNAELTKYEGLFNNTYWGRSISDPQTTNIEEIINNRNLFIEKYEIVACKKLVDFSKCKEQEFSRPLTNYELYIDTHQNGIYLVYPPIEISNNEIFNNILCSCQKAKIDDLFKALGYEKEEDTLIQGCISYLKIIENKEISVLVDKLKAVQSIYQQLSSLFFI